MAQAERQWHALYVRARHEKKVAYQLDQMGIEAFLPLVTRLKVWSDRKKKVAEPLFKSYVFVRSCEKDYLNIITVFGVVRFVSFEHKAVVVPDSQIVAIKKYVDGFSEEQENLNKADLQPGQAVRIISGPMKGLTGRLKAVDKKKRLEVYIEAVAQYISISIDRAKVEPIADEETKVRLPDA